MASLYLAYALTDVHAKKKKKVKQNDGQVVTN